MIENIRKALLTRLFMIIPPSDVDTENENPSAESNLSTPFYKSFLIPAQSDNLSIDTMDANASGFFQVSLYFPINKGSGLRDAKADEIMSHFVGQTLTYGDVKVKILTQPSFTRLTNTADRYIGAVRITYSALKL